MGFIFSTLSKNYTRVDRLLSNIANLRAVDITFDTVYLIIIRISTYLDIVKDIV